MTHDKGSRPQPHFSTFSKLKKTGASSMFDASAFTICYLLQKFTSSSYYLNHNDGLVLQLLPEGVVVHRCLAVDEPVGLPAWRPPPTVPAAIVLKSQVDSPSPPFRVGLLAKQTMAVAHVFRIMVMDRQTGDRFYLGCIRASVVLPAAESTCCGPNQRSYLISIHLKSS